MNPVVILGSGMAGLGAAHRLREAGISGVIYEKRAHAGGHTASWSDGQGFVFDEGPHISFTTDRRIQALLDESVGGRQRTFDAVVDNYWRGHRIKHPVQCNLHGLPADLVVDIVKDFVAASQAKPGLTENYREWLSAAYGRTFAETFPVEYCRKYHTTGAENLSTDWLGPRLYRPSLEEVLRGALSPTTADVHYVRSFRYPIEGGFVSFLSGLIARTAIRTGFEMAAIDPRRRRVLFTNGEVVEFGGLISSIPLPELVPRIEGAPRAVREASARLACTSCMIVNVGVARAELSAAHWTYFYDPDVVFTRLSFPHLFSPNNAPPGMGSIQAEIYFSNKYRALPMGASEAVEATLRDLRRCGILRPDDRIVLARAQLIPYANVIFDLERAEALAIVRTYLDEVGIATCGRYGEWGYHWTDEAFRSGEEAALRVLDRTTVV